MADNRHNKLRIACYGHVEKKAGSLAGANFLLLEELLKRGYNIDFYNIKNFVYPKGLFIYENFHYIDVTTKILENFWRAIHPKLNIIFRYIIGSVVNFIYAKKIARISIKNHRTRRYNLLLFLGIPAHFRIKSAHAISWLQTPPQTEKEAIKKNKQIITRLCGIFKYTLIMIYYTTYKRLIAKSWLKKSDIFVVGSQWSVEKLIACGVKKQFVKALPYPIDLHLFSPQIVQRNKTQKKIFLYLGRLDPRKRLDLLLDGFSMLLEERKDVFLKIIGRFSYAREYKKLIDNFKFPEYIEYQGFVERAKVPELMSSVDILIQPSENENFGSSVAEALCCGIPVIVGPTNGTKDYVGASSFIFSDYSPKSVKESMSKALEAIEKDREKLSYEARRTAEQNFDVTKIVDKLEDIFKEAMQIYR